MKKAQVGARAGLAVWFTAGLMACGGGGGGGGPSTSFSFELASASVPEGGGPLSMTVVLRTSFAALSPPATIDVVDTGTGTATSGVDYSAFAPVTVTFPIGAVDGDTRLVSSPRSTTSRSKAPPRRCGSAPERGRPRGQELVTFTATVTDIHVATIEFSLAASTTPDESSSPRASASRSTFPRRRPGGRRDGARASDAGGGSASSGVDYAALAPVIVSFPAGSADGARRTSTYRCSTTR